MAKINPSFGKELNKYGAINSNACYNCGNCTAVCSLSTEEVSFPREMVRLSTLGLEDDIQSSLKPWECYYCGECSTHCPQEANPSELMMSLRRYLTAKYDWTGLSGLMYKSLPLSIAAFVLTLVGVLIFAFSVDFVLEKMVHIGHLFEMIAIGTVGLVILLPNVARMWWFTILKPGTKVSFKKYLSSMGDLFVHMFTQKRALGCDDNQLRWFEHFLMVIGYLSLLFTTVFLNWFSSEYLIVTIFGYVVSAIVFVVTFDFVLSRIKKKKEISKHSQPSDWFFVIWLFLMGLSAFMVRLFIDLDLLETNKWLYLVHLTVLVQWALIIVPFGKWTHFLYRSFAMYFAKLKA
ncbi:MAG: 4Fe-4S dicluster domain-containing protein [Bacteroidales bacterium]|jgi:ferredoxin|nr:4Fe-4S dicluster domain-containing protein [Bacteroidales bacterium]